jgi:hypothetical protein
MSNDQKKIVSASAAEPLGAELERLLQPTRYFQHPRDVVRDAILTTAEKRAILSSWASDASAVESMPALRQILGSGHVVKFDEVIDALQARPATWAWRNRGAGTVARIAAAIPRRARAEPVFGTDLSPAAIIVFLPLDGKSRSPKSSSLIAHPGIGTVQRGGRSLGAPCFHVAQRRMWL